MPGCEEPGPSFGKRKLQKSCRGLINLRPQEVRGKTTCHRTKVYLSIDSSEGRLDSRQWTVVFNQEYLMGIFDSCWLMLTESRPVEKYPNPHFFPMTCCETVKALSRRKSFDSFEFSLFCSFYAPLFPRSYCVHWSSSRLPMNILRHFPDEGELKDIYTRS